MSDKNFFEKQFEQNLELCLNEYKTLYNDSEKPICVCAPGRVNLIGEHTDYNDGFVLPMAIPLYTIIVGRVNIDGDDLCKVKSLEKNLDTSDYVEFSINNQVPSKTEHRWANYIKGIVAYFKGKKVPFKAVIKSNVPLGSGLSSSASLEVATYTFLENLTNEFTDLKEKALLCQKAEHNFASVPCGIMDQFISIMAKENNALLIDCRSLESTLYPMSDPNVSVLITNSNVKHQLEGSEYSNRRGNCELAAKLLGVSSLRDASIPQLDAKRNELDDETYRRAKHAISEIKRTEEAAQCLKSNNLEQFGKLMYDSHESLKNDFNVSCVELDELVDIARKCEGVLGSRMTGAGFGGCTVTLVRDNNNLNNLINKIKEEYKGKPTFYVCRPCEGAHLIDN